MRVPFIISLLVLSLSGFFAGIYLELQKPIAGILPGSRMRRPLLVWTAFLLTLLAGQMLPGSVRYFVILASFTVEIGLAGWLLHRNSPLLVLKQTLVFLSIVCLSALLCTGAERTYVWFSTGNLPDSALLLCMTGMNGFLFLGLSHVLQLYRKKNSDFTGLWVLLCGFGSLSCAVLAGTQRILQSQEDIVSNSEVFTFLVLYLAGFVFLTLLFFFQKRHSEKELAGIQECIEVQNVYYASLEQSSTEFETRRNEYEKQISGLLETLRQSGPRQAQEMIDDLFGEITRTRIPKYCAVPAVNAILYEKSQICQEAKIRFSADLKFNEPVLIPSLDLCIALGNILDNALRACQRLDPAESRYIELRGRLIQNSLILECANSCRENRRKVIYGTGYGQQILKDLAGKYNGSFTVSSGESQSAGTGCAQTYTCTLILENRIQETVISPVASASLPEVFPSAGLFGSESNAQTDLQPEDPDSADRRTL